MQRQNRFALLDLANHNTATQKFWLSSILYSTRMPCVGAAVRQPCDTCRHLTPVSCVTNRLMSVSKADSQGTNDRCHQSNKNPQQGKTGAQRQCQCVLGLAHFQLCQHTSNHEIYFENPMDSPRIISVIAKRKSWSTATFDSNQCDWKSH